MTSLNDHQKQLLFDYCVGITSDKETAQAQELVFSNAQASQMCSKIRAALAPLASIEQPVCPKELAEGTIWRLNSLARSSQPNLEQLLADEQARSVGTKRRFWRNFGQVAAAAAVIVGALAIWQRPLTFARQKYWQQRCQRQLAGVFRGLNSYASDHDGKLPAVAIKQGSPYWKVGYQGDENHSTTRNMWLLVKNGYVEPAYFVCPGRRQQSPKRIDQNRLKSLRDFPTRAHISYSVQIWCPKSSTAYRRGGRVLMTDLSPLFENLPEDFTKPFKLRLSKELLTVNSINHNGRGQNILCCDGTVKFIRTRNAGILADDIFTLKEMSDGFELKGCEMPSCETDTFCAP
ncbi:MAG: hypothetical protein ACYTEL_14765 [Planctomycetota bacterium]|jgi:hypothetical protein